MGLGTLHQMSEVGIDGKPRYVAVEEIQESPGTWEPRIPTTDFSGSSGRGNKMKPGLQEARHSQETGSPTGSEYTGHRLGRCADRSQESAAHQAVAQVYLAHNYIRYYVG